MTALVVGGSGFLGKAVVRALAERGVQPLALSRAGTPVAGVGTPVARAGTPVADAGTSVAGAGTPVAGVGTSVAGTGIRGDATLPDLGLTPETARRLRIEVTHIVSCFGSVDWDAGPRQALDLHCAGTKRILDFAASCPRIERVVHVSSVLALGRAQGTIGNRELVVGQGFRNWYEYGKYLAECAVRREERVPSRILRIGPVLGVLEDQAPDPRYGLPAAVPYLLRGYPAHLARRGSFPCYVTDVQTAAAVVADALYHPEGGSTWTWYDPARPSLAEVLVNLCAAWNVVPRIVDARALAGIALLVARRVGVPGALQSYADPWVDIDSAVLSELPIPHQSPPANYLRLTGEAMRNRLPGAFA